MFVGSVWLHKKTKNLYTIIGECQMEATWERGVLYVRTDGNSERPIARSYKEFTDGRFERFK